MAKLGERIEIGLSWAPLVGGRIPPKAIDVGGGVFIARGSLYGELIPGKYVAKYGKCYVSYNYREHELLDCEVLCDTCISSDGRFYEWKEDNGGKVPEHAIVGGIAKDGEPLYICMASIAGEKCVGKVHKGHLCGYVPYGGKEHIVRDYKVLCLQQK